MMTECTFAVVDECAMVQLGHSLGLDLAASPHLLIFLEGDLGAGKTTLCRGILKAFGHQGTVKSPTYTLVESYKFEDLEIHHFDLYRLGHPEELEFIGIRDYFQSGNYCLVEWPNRGDGILPTADIVVNIAVTQLGRTVTIVAGTQAGKSSLIHFIENQRDTCDIQAN